MPVGADADLVLQPVGPDQVRGHVVVDPDARDAEVARRDEGSEATSRVSPITGSADQERLAVDEAEARCRRRTRRSSTPHAISASSARSGIDPVPSAPKWSRVQTEQMTTRIARPTDVSSHQVCCASEQLRGSAADEQRREDDEGRCPVGSQHERGRIGRTPSGSAPCQDQSVAFGQSGSRRARPGGCGAWSRLRAALAPRPAASVRPAAPATACPSRRRTTIVR